MSTLHELFSAESELAAARVVGAALPPAIEGQVRRRVRASHTRRAAGLTALATMAVAAVSVGVVLGYQAWGPQGPAVEPPITGSTHPTPSPDVSEPTPGVGLGVLPPVEPAPTGIFDAAIIGWSLVTYVPADGGEQHVYLVTDAGRVYGLTTLAGAPVVEIVAWRPGLDYAVVRVVDVKANGDRFFRDLEVLDLKTGDLLSSDSPWAGADGTMGPLTEGGTLTVTSGTQDDIAWDENGPVATVTHPASADAPWDLAKRAISGGSDAGAAIGPIPPVAVPSGVVYTTTMATGTCADAVWHADVFGTPIDISAGLRGAVPSVETIGSLAVAGDWAYVRFGGACADGGPGGLARLALDGLSWQVLIAPTSLALDAGDRGVTSIVTAMPGESLR